MEFLNSDETLPENPENSQESQPTNSFVEDHDDGGAVTDGESSSSSVVVDIAGQSLDFSIPEKSLNAAGALYLYKNEFNLLPKSISRGAKRLKTLKFFANEICLFPPSSAAEELGSLESLQVKMSSPGFSGLPLKKLEGLKELELSKVPSRASGLEILNEVSGLKCLTKLSLCHLSIRYLPPEIGYLEHLEHLDLSYNKMKSLAAEIGNLNALISLEVSNNRLVELPWNLSLLQSLEFMDLSYNQLASLGSFEVELELMPNLQTLNLQYNKLLNECQIPSWICCNLEGNAKDSTVLYHDFSSSSDEMEFCESGIDQKGEGEVSSRRRGKIRHRSASRGCGDRRLGRWRRKRRKTLKQRADQECLNNNSRKRSKDLVVSESFPESVSEVINPDGDDDDDDGDGDGDRDLLLSKEVQSKNVNGAVVGDCSSSSTLRSSIVDKDDEKDQEVSSVEQEQVSSSEVKTSSSRPKRLPDEDLDDPTEPKYPKNRADSSSLSCKYSDLSWCSSEDHLEDGFYDAGRDRPFMSLEFYEQKFHLDSREVLLVDRECDQELDAISRSAQEGVYRLNTDENQADELQIASFLALLVSDHFGGSDRTAQVERARKINPFSDYRKPFVCTCPTGNRELSSSTKPVTKTVEDIGLADLCEKSLRSIKAQRNSMVVPIGTLQFGVCRHRALLLKYLCDSVDPRVPCELVRGYMDFMPHAWNVVLVKRGDSEIRRMVVDACRPLDIREETNPELYFRYIPLNHTQVPLPTARSLPSCGKTLTDSGTSLIRSKYGSNEAAGKMRSLKVCGTSKDEIRSFDYNCLGEVRILRALQHPCIIEMYGHQISSKWVPSVDGSPDHRILQSVIWMEDIKGGSLRSYIDKLSEAGEKQVPVELAMCIAKDVACALLEVHSKHIIHRDIKSANVLVDLDTKRADGTPVVKLCDFDRAVPLRSYLHTCCIAHVGIPRPDVCVGTPRWMAPEVLRATHEPNNYGLEIDIWSFGCLLLELLTLKVPYLEVPQPKIHRLLAMGKRPQLTHELEALRLLDEPAMRTAAHLATKRFLVDLFYQCTEENPKYRPTAHELYELLLDQSNTLPN